MRVDTPKAGSALFWATLAFVANFSVWTLFAVLGLELRSSLSLSSTQLGVFFAAPMLTGALLRIPAGFLCEKHDPKKLFALQMLIVVPSLFILPYLTSFVHYILLGLWVGISGVSFTIGIRYIGDWFDRNRQGSAMGVFGAGNAGAAVTFILTPLVIGFFGWEMIGPFYGTGLLAVTILFALFAPTSPKKEAVNQELAEPLGELLLNPRIWRFGLYYYFVFGSFLALIMWLPQYYVRAYQLNLNQAMVYTLIFAASSSIVRALGGWFADRYGGRYVNWSVFWVCLVCLFFLSYPPTTMTIHGVESDVALSVKVNLWVFNALIFIIGIAQGFGRASVYKTIHDYYPNRMGSIGGIVAAIGAMGGCTLPIMFGLSVDIIGVHSACFMLLYGVLAACMIALFIAIKTERHQQRVKEARSKNFLELDSLIDVPKRSPADLL